MSRNLTLLASCLWGLPVSASIVSDWNETALAEVRLSRQGPPIVARSLAIAHTCIYDAWTAYDSRALGSVVGDSLRRPVPEHTDANKAKAISFAAYNCLVNLFPAGATRLADAMRQRGYDPADRSVDLRTPQGIGNAAASAVIASRRYDGANQYGDLAPGAYADYTGFVPRNAPMPYCDPLTVGPCSPNVTDIYHWQPLVSNTGATQRFIAPHWERVRPFALPSATVYATNPDIAPLPNYLQAVGRLEADVAQMIAISGALTEPQKLAVEYWADGPDTELPPGHWSLFAQHVSHRDSHGIDQDAKMYFAMQNASFDAGIVAWHMKRHYQGVRPITAVRQLMQGRQVFAWGGPGQPNGWIPGEKWTPYNPGSNLSPAFPGYVSGHSTFSAASATVLQAFTGSDRFGFSTIIPPNFGRVEPGVPQVPTTLSYATFTDAVQDAGLSRLYAGIHFADDNTIGQGIGYRVGQTVWQKAQFLADGGLALDTTSSTVGNNIRRLVWRHQVPARSNRLLLVGVSYRNGVDPVSQVSYGGQPLRLLAARNGPNNQNRVEVWYLTAPPAGSADVVVTLPKDKKVVAGAMSFTGADQLAPLGTVRTAADDSGRACVTLANAPAPLVASVLATNGEALSINPKSGQLTAWAATTGRAGGDILAAGSTGLAAPVATLCQNLGDEQPWSLVTVPLRAAVQP